MIGSHIYGLFTEVIKERIAQDKKFGGEHWPQHNELKASRYWAREPAWQKDSADRCMANGMLTWQSILYEEICEAFAETEWPARRAELVQCAAVIFAMIEDGDGANGSAEASTTPA